MSRMPEMPFDAGGSYAIAKARASAPGPGMGTLLTRWCFRCETHRPLAGGRMVRGLALWKCAVCSTPKTTTESQA